MNLNQIMRTKTEVQMSSWKVKEIKSGNLIVLSSNWKWKDNIGNEVLVDGYKLAIDGKPTQFVDILAKERLADLLTGKEITLLNASEIVLPNQRIKSHVILNGVDIAEYFPEFSK